MQNETKFETFFRGAKAMNCPRDELQAMMLINDRLVAAIVICESHFGQAWKPEHAIAILVEISEQANHPKADD